MNPLMEKILLSKDVLLPLAVNNKEDGASQMNQEL